MVVVVAGEGIHDRGQDPDQGPGTEVAAGSPGLTAKAGVGAGTEAHAKAPAAAHAEEGATANQRASPGASPGAGVDPHRLQTPASGNGLIKG